MLRLMTLEQLAARLRKVTRGADGNPRASVQSIYALRKRQTAPPGVTLGGRLMFREDDVEAWLADLFAREPLGITDNPRWESGIPLLTLDEAAERLHVVPGTLKLMRHQRRAPRAAVVAGSLLFREDDVETWLAGRFAAEATRTAQRSA